jgi:hypothetical protein
MAKREPKPRSKPDQLSIDYLLRLFGANSPYLPSSSLIALAGRPVIVAEPVTRLRRLAFLVLIR